MLCPLDHRRENSFERELIIYKILNMYRSAALVGKTLRAGNEST